MLIANKVWIDDALHDISELNQFYIDPQGNKHIAQLNTEWQLLACKFADLLIEEEGKWRVKAQEKQAESVGQSEMLEKTKSSEPLAPAESTPRQSTAEKEKSKEELIEIRKSMMKRTSHKSVTPKKRSDT